MVGRWVAQPSNWPGDERRRALVYKTQGLFICATTVAGMLADSNFRDPEAQLEGILSSKDRIRLDDIYAQILNRACPVRSHRDLLTLFRNVLGALIVARVPINIHALASLLSPDGAQHIEFAHRVRGTVLSYLQAVLIVPDVETSEVARDVQPIRFIHTSFVDYLTDKSRCEPRFLLDLREQHEQLAIGCLRRMRDLKRNMCDLDPSLLNSEVEDLEQRIRDNLSPGLQYACTQMSMHVSQTPAESAGVWDLVEEFADVRLMYWIEGLSLMGRVHEAVGMASLIESWLKVGLHLHPLTSRPSSKAAPVSHSLNNLPTHPITSVYPSDSVAKPSVLGKRAKVKRFFRGAFTRAPSPTTIVHTPLSPPSPVAIASSKLNGWIAEIFYDLQRFIMAFMEPMIACSLHIYYSALVLVPSATELSHQYGHLAQGSVSAVRGRAEDWSQTLWTATKHSGGAGCVAVLLMG
ncbi:hypothetical protein FRB95_007597 [Tulasnella sp. JGI-2019a]|nr:hypothetical protein FRB95_007597 [Tulasnella sp. JGI-2019a]